MASPLKSWLMPSLLLFVLTFLGVANVNQSWHYRLQERELERLHHLQLDQLESNKRLLAEITALGAPERLLTIVAQNPEWDLVRLKPEQIIVFNIKELQP
jgi:hypothetical protein